MESKGIHSTNGMENQMRIGPSTVGCNVGNREPQNIDEGLNLVPIENKTALLHACMVCPALVQRESPPLRFLEFERFHYYAAAVRWAKYWEVRFKSFGPDRAFLPIADFTGNGAIPADLIDFIATGVGVVLPPDDQQRPVLFIDRSRIPLECLHWPNECRQKLAFAILQKIMLLSNNFVMIFFASSKPRFFPGMGEWFNDALIFAFPMKLSAIYIACKSPKSRFKSFVATYVPVMLKLLNKNFQHVFVDIYVGDREELLKKLILKGLNPADIPESVGGSWKYEVYEEWVRRQKETLIDTSLQESAISNGLKMLAVTMDESNGSRSMNMQEQKQDIDFPVSLDEKPAAVESTKQHSIGNILGSETVRNEIDAIELGEKLAYIEVLSVAPQLETAEARVDLFLSAENGNAKQAAKRIVNYWKVRRSIFKDFFLRPLQQKVGGALNDVDLRTMKCGYIVLLPKNNDGHSVLCCDASRLTTDDEASRLRCLFYMLRVASQQSSENADVSVLLIMNKLSFERTKGTVALAEILKVYPVRITSIHVIRQPARLGMNFFEEKVVPTVRSIFCSLPSPIHIHSGTPNCDIRQDLVSHGFDIKNLPRSLGGGWTYDDFLRWRDEQVKFEEASLLQNCSNVTSGHFLPSTVLGTAMVTLQNPVPHLHSTLPLSLPSTDRRESYPTQSFSVPQNLVQHQTLQSQSLAQNQQTLQFYQNLDLQLLQLNQNLETQYAHRIHQQMDQQHVSMLHQHLGHQQFLPNFQQQVDLQQISGNNNVHQKTDPLNDVPTSAPSLADVLHSLRVNQWNNK